MSSEPEEWEMESRDSFRCSSAPGVVRGVSSDSGQSPERDSGVSVHSLRMADLRRAQRTGTSGPEGSSGGTRPPRRRGAGLWAGSTSTGGPSPVAAASGSTPWSRR